MNRSRRRLLQAGLTLGVAPGCLLPDRAGPRIRHAVYPAGPLPAPRGSPRQLWVGVAAVDLTPPAGQRVWLAGYGFQRRMQRLADPISARALVFDTGARRVALVVADVVGLPYPAVERVRRLLGPGIDVVVASTHNHQAPDTIGYWGPAILHAVPAETGIDVAYQRVLEQRLAAAVVRAARAVMPCRSTAVRVPLTPRWVRNLRDPEDVPSSLLAMEWRAAGSGRTIATLVQGACHPETLGPRAHTLTADFPGALRTALEAARGGTAVYVNGALGGMLTAAVDDGADEAARADYAARMGRAWAGAAAAALASTEPLVEGPGAGHVAYAGRRLEVPVTNELFTLLEAKGLVEARRRGPSGGLVTEVGRLDLGAVSFAVMPGEPSPEVGRQAQARLTSALTGVIGLGNDELGYLLTPDQFDDPAFAYEVSVSPGRAATGVLLDALSTTQSKAGSERA